jgi:hypothetical protein
MNKHPAYLKRISIWINLVAITSLSIYFYLKPDRNFRDFFLFLPFLVIIYLFRSGYFYRGLRFDTHFFYVSKQLRIPLSSIHSVKLTNASDVYNNRFWTVKYFSDKEHSVKVLPSLIDDNFARFLLAVKVANPSVDTDSFEFKLYYDWIPRTSWRPNTKS